MFDFRNSKRFIVVHSMTAFARGVAQGSWGSAIWEIRSVNHRYLDINLRLPETLRSLEEVLRAQLKDELQRGRIDGVLHYELGDAVCPQYHVNQSLVRQLLVAREQLTELFSELAPLDVMQLLNWPGVLQTVESDMSQVFQAVKQLFEKTLQDLSLARKREGQSLATVIHEKIQFLSKYAQEIREQAPKFAEDYQQKIKLKFAEANLVMDENRLAQEMIMMLQKSDIAEELDRIESHITEVKRLLKDRNPKGRALDFIMQELHREANTISAKSTQIGISRIIVDVKVLIEQMREQVQNIE